jgi:hypothetical protein
LSIDQNRTTVVDRVVAAWGDALVAVDVGLTKDELRTVLNGLRSDQLLAASLAGSLDGLRNVIANALTANAPIAKSLVQTKALGDAGDDLVYTPVVPCRIIDTRNVGGTFAAGGETRNYHAFLTSGTFATQGGDATNCAIPANPGAVVLNFAVIGGCCFLTAWPYNSSQPLASTLNPAAGQTLANGAIVPTCQPNCAAEFSVFTFGAHMIVDIVGYFKAPGAPIGTVSNIATGTGLAGGPITTTGTISIAPGGVGPTQLAANAVTQSKLSPLSGAASGKVLGTDGTNLQWQSDANSGGTLTAVTASAPLASSGGNTPNISLTGTVPVANGGTGQATLVANGILIGAGTGPVATAVGTTGQVLAGTAGAPAWTGSPSLSGNLTLVDSTAAAGNIMKGAARFIHNFGANNTFIGANAGNLTMTGQANTGSGATALGNNTTGILNTANGAGALAANTTGTQNTATGASALASNTTATQNTANGTEALFTNLVAPFNTAVGYQALRNSGPAVGAAAILAARSYTIQFVGTTDFTLIGASSNTVGTLFIATGPGSGTGTAAYNSGNNTAIGSTALFSNTGGGGNTGSGSESLRVNTLGSSNTANGYAALRNNTTGNFNTASGRTSLYSNMTGDFNTAMGGDALRGGTGSNNTAMGSAALYGAVSGSFNTALGANAGANLTTGDYNIDIGNWGVAGEGNTIRIGDANQTRTFIAGIRGVTTATAAIAVVIDTNGQLGTTSSSRRYKDDIVDMDDASAALMKLRPVTFHYKSDRNVAGRTLHYGLIAEEVASVYPGMVARSANGEIETVMYQFLPPMLLNELQKQQRTIRAQAAEMGKQTQRIAELEAHMARIAALEQQRQLQATRME